MKLLSRFSDIRPDDIRRAAGHARFGDGTDAAEVVLDGLVSVACGFSPGYTVRCILMDLKLVGWRQGKTLTKRGRMVLHDLLRGVYLVPKIEAESTTNTKRDER